MAQSARPAAAGGTAGRPSPPDNLATKSVLELYAREAAKAALQSQQRLEKLQEYGRELETAAQLAEELPGRLSHEVLVPFGKHAFFPGKLIHTNELTMHLGGQYYAERTAPAVAAALRRRAAAIARSASDAAHEVEGHQARLDLPATVLGAGAAATGAGQAPPELQALTLEEDERMWRQAKAVAEVAAGLLPGPAAAPASAAAAPRPAALPPALSAAGGTGRSVPPTDPQPPPAHGAPPADSAVRQRRVSFADPAEQPGHGAATATAAAAPSSSAGGTTGSSVVSTSDDAETERVMAMLARMEALEEEAEAAAAAGLGDYGEGVPDSDDDEEADSGGGEDGDEDAFQPVQWPPQAAPAGSQLAPAPPASSHPLHGRQQPPAATPGTRQPAGPAADVGARGSGAAAGRGAGAGAGLKRGFFSSKPAAPAPVPTAPVPLPTSRTQEAAAATSAPTAGSASSQAAAGPTAGPSKATAPESFTGQVVEHGWQDSGRSTDRAGAVVSSTRGAGAGAAAAGAGGGWGGREAVGSDAAEAAPVEVKRVSKFKQKLMENRGM